MEIKNPTNPSKAIPIADIFATIQNSLEVGFFKECQTLLDFMKNDFKFVKVSFIQIIRENGF